MPYAYVAKKPNLLPKALCFFFLTSKVELKIYYVFISMYVYIHICLHIHVTNNIDRGILFM